MTSRSDVVVLVEGHALTVVNAELQVLSITDIGKRQIFDLRDLGELRVDFNNQPIVINLDDEEFHLAFDVRIPIKGKLQF